MSMCCTRPSALVVSLFLFAFGFNSSASPPQFLTQFFDSGPAYGVALSPDKAKLIRSEEPALAVIYTLDNSVQPVALVGHSLEVLSVAYSSDGAKVATSSADGDAIIWDASTGDELIKINAIDTDAAVRGVAFSPDGALLLTGGDDSEANLWSTVDGSLVRNLTGHSSVVTSVGFSADGVICATGSLDGTAKVWTVSTGNLNVTVSHGSSVRAVGLNLDGTHVMTGGDDNTARSFETDAGSPLATFAGHAGPVSAVAFSPDGDSVLTASEDKTVRVWSVSGTELNSFSGHFSGITSAMWSSDSLQMVTGSMDGTARVWDPNGSIIRSFSGHGSTVLSADAANGISRAASGDSSGTAIVWDTPTGSILQSISAHSSAVSGIALSSDGTNLLTGSFDSTAALWDVSDGSSIAVFTGHSGDVNAVTLSSDATIAVTASEDATAKTWNAANGSVLQTFTGHTLGVLSIALSADDTVLATGSKDDLVKLWTVSSGAEIRTLTGHTDDVSGVAFFPGGAKLVTASRDQTIRIWNVSDGSQIVSVSVGSPLKNVAVSGDGGLIVSCADDSQIRIHDARNGQLLRTISANIDDPTDIDFTFDSSELFTSSLDLTPKLRLASGGELKRIGAGQSGGLSAVAIDSTNAHVLTASEADFLPTTRSVGSAPWAFRNDLIGHTDGVSDAVYSPDLSQIATAGLDGSVRLWTYDGTFIRKLGNHSGAANCVAFLPDGSGVFSGGDDNKVLLWDVATGTQLAEFIGHADGVTAVAVSADGAKMFSGSRDQTVKFWDVPGQTLINTFTGHTASITDVAVSGLGNQAVSSAGNGEAIVWRIFDLATVQTFSVTTDFSMNSAVFMPDSGRVLTGSEDGVARIWDVISGNELRRFQCSTKGLIADRSADGAVVITGGIGSAALWDGSIPSVAPATATGTTPTNGQNVTFEVVFSEPVTGVDASDFAVNANGGVVAPSVAGVSGNGTIFTVTVDTGTGDGDVRLNVVDDDSIVDSTGGPLGGTGTGNGDVAGDEFFSIDRTPPDITVLGNAPETVEMGSTYTDAGATALDNLDGDVANNISTNNPVNTSVVGGYVVTYNVSDSAGNAATQASRTVNVVDTTSPNVVLTSPSGSVTNVSVTITVTTTELTTDLVAGDIAVTNASVSDFAGSGTSYTFTLNPIAQGAFNASIPGGRFTDAATNVNTVSNTLAFTFDTVLPTVQLISPSPNFTTVSPILVTVAFSEPVLGFTSADIGVTNGSIVEFSGAGQTYSFSLTPASAGQVTAQVVSGGATDLAGNEHGPSNLFTRTFSDSTATNTLVGAIIGISPDAGPKLSFQRLPNALVRVSAIEVDVERLAATDQNGEYRIADLPVGSYEVEVFANGFASEKRTTALPASPSPTTFNVFLGESSGLGGLSGIVLDAITNEPLVGVRIDLFIGKAEPIATTFTGGDGTYEISGLGFKAATDVTVTYTSLSYESEELTVSIDPAAPLVEESPTLAKSVSAPGSLAGVVEGDAKAILPNARVTITGLVFLSEFTDVQGVYNFDALPEGNYGVEISAEGFETHFGAIDVVALTPTEFSIALAPSGAVVDPSIDDVDGNGALNAVDVQLVINGALGLLGGVQFDVDRDGSINAVDVQRVINAALGLKGGR